VRGGIASNGYAPFFCAFAERLRMAYKSFLFASNTIIAERGVKAFVDAL
jgi:hypothetical protein